MASHAAQTVTVTTTDADGTRALGARLAALLRRGDLVMLSGGLGAGKTTLAQGIGSALEVRGRVASPTFIIARVHPALGQGPDLIHVDAYRLSSLEEIDALDLDSSLEESVTLVEWGEDKVEALSEDRLEVAVSRPHGGLAPAEHAPGAPVPADRADAEQDADTSSEADDVAGSRVTDLAEADDGRRTITVTAVGQRWADVDLSCLLG